MHETIHSGHRFETLLLGLGGALLKLAISSCPDDPNRCFMYWRYYVALVVNFNSYECLISDRKNTHAETL
jgi:hypothetical protein